MVHIQAFLISHFTFIMVTFKVVANPSLASSPAHLAFSSSRIASIWLSNFCSFSAQVFSTKFNACPVFPVMVTFISAKLYHRGIGMWLLYSFQLHTTLDFYISYTRHRALSAYVNTKCSVGQGPPSSNSNPTFSSLNSSVSTNFPIPF